VIAVDDELRDESSETFELDEEHTTELAARVRAADRGETVRASVVLAKLRSRSRITE
jgi:hypothetical protein